MNSGRMRVVRIASASQNGDGDVTALGGVDIGHNFTENQSVPTVVISSQQAQNESTNLQSEPELQKLKIPRVSFDSDDSGDELERDARNRRRIRPKGNFLQCEDRVLKVIKHIINSHFDGPWTSFSKVPRKTKKLWWDEFQKQYYWKDRHATKIKAIWRSKCSQHLRNTFHDARKANLKPPFVSPENWAIMKSYWDNNDKFKLLSETNTKNRAVEGPDGFSNYAGGSRSVVENVEQIEKNSGRRMTQEELIMAMYHSQKKGKYTDDRAQKNLDNFHSLCEKWMESYPGEAIPQEEINKLWLLATQNDGSLRVYGQGSMYHKMDNVLNPASSQAQHTIGSSHVVSSPCLLEGVQPRLHTSPAPPPIENHDVLTSPPSLEGVQPRPSTPPQPYFPAPPSPHNAALLAQVAPSSSNENENRRELEYLRIAHHQQQQLVKQLLLQINQGGMPRMDTSRSVVSNTMQDGMTFQEYMNSDGNIMGNSSTPAGSFPNFY